jgi:small-conductance mechanosensitive channel
MAVLPASRLLRRLALALVLVLAPIVARADDLIGDDFGAARATLADIDATLKNPDLSDSDLQRLRAADDPLGLALQAYIGDLTPRLEASKRRLAELAPAARENLAETNVASADYANEKKKHDELDANLRSARALKLQVDDDGARIAAARRELFARQTFALSSSVLNPGLWLSVWREAPNDARATGGLISGWWAGVAARLTVWQIAVMIGVAVFAIVLFAPVRWVARRVIWRDPSITAPSRLRRALAAAWTAVVLAVLPLLVLGALVLLLDVLDISDPRIEGVAYALFDGLRFLIIANALARGVLAPYRPSWRMLPVGDRVAGILFSHYMAAAAISAISRLVEPAADTVASLNIAVAGRAVSALLIAIVMMNALRRLVGPAPASAAAPQIGDPWGPARTLGWVVALTILAATLSGYIALATFVINQIMLLTIVVAALYLVDAIIQDGADALLQPNARFGSQLLINIGLGRDSLAQFTVLFQGLARIAVLIVAVFFVMRPWGVQSPYLFPTLRSAYFGFTIGGVTISRSSMVGAVVMFVLAVFATRVVQNWLSARFLPRTRLDAGVSNSVRTILGYIGFVLALVLGGAQLGLDIQKFLIVAGALSVGIGFGLQSIVNNFVSGLILLWERGIRVGDWVVVGTEQGFVRRINARATEIETFDRATLIVPNANLVSGVVKNWVHNDHVGRVIVAINVAYESDAEQVREILLAAAKAQDSVLSIPAPSVILSEFADWALKFQLICFVDEVESADRTRSEINFDVLRRLREANMRIPYPK